jgi:2TM domain
MSIDENPTEPEQGAAEGGESLRARAVARLRKQAGFRIHLVIYIAVNAFLVAVWWLTTQGFFWPVFPIGGWGIGVVANAWDAYGPDHVTEERIRREMDRLR